MEGQPRLLKVGSTSYLHYAVRSLSMRIPMFVAGLCRIVSDS